MQPQSNDRCEKCGVEWRVPDFPPGVCGAWLLGCDCPVPTLEEKRKERKQLDKARKQAAKVRKEDRMNGLTQVDDPRFLLAVSLMHNALNDAERKHPEYRYSNLRKTAIIAEEAGEALRAALEQQEAAERGEEPIFAPYVPSPEISDEVAQAGAMCLRYLMDAVH